MASCNTISYNDVTSINGLAPTDEIIIVKNGQPLRMTVADFFANFSYQDTHLFNENLTLLEQRIHQLEAILSFMGVGKIGIGTENPASKLTVAEGDIEITDKNKGLIQTDGSDNRQRQYLDENGIITIDDV